MSGTPRATTRQEEELQAMSDQDAVVVMRFGTLCGGIVVVTRDPDRTRERIDDHAWQCLGCREGQQDPMLSVIRARRQANQHAGECRSMPLAGEG